jgi:glycosyltransferase involved in cell wall biosynthesis
MNRTIWIVNHYAVPPGNAGGTRHYTLAKYLQPLGWQATIIAGSVEHNSTVQRLNKGEYMRAETLENVPFLWLRVPVRQGNGLGRLCNMLLFAYRFLRYAHQPHLPKPDVVIGSSPQPFAAFAAYVLARRYRAAFYYEVRDLWPAGLVNLGHIPAYHPLMLLFGWVERFLAHRADGIIALLPDVKDYFGQLGVPATRVHWIPNGIDAELFAHVPQATVREPFTLMYFGAFGTANGLDNLLHAMKQIEQESPDLPVQLRLIGAGPAKAGLVKMAEALNLKTVHFENTVSKQHIPTLAAQADGFIFNLTDASVFIKYGISSNKLFDFMAAARPVIFCCRSACLFHQTIPWRWHKPFGN